MLDSKSLIQKSPSAYLEMSNQDAHMSDHVCTIKERTHLLSQILSVSTRWSDHQINRICKLLAALPMFTSNDSSLMPSMSDLLEAYVTNSPDRALLILMALHHATLARQYDHQPTHVCIFVSFMVQTFAVFNWKTCWPMFSTHK